MPAIFPKFFGINHSSVQIDSNNKVSALKSTSQHCFSCARTSEATCDINLYEYSLLEIPEIPENPENCKKRKNPFIDSEDSKQEASQRKSYGRPVRGGLGNPPSAKLNLA